MYHIPDRKKKPTMKSSKNIQSSKGPATAKKKNKSKKA
jgi:hypothetical protein